MSEALIDTPRPDDEDWAIFERGRDKGDIGLISQLRIDATLRRMHIAAQNMTFAELEDLAARAEEHLRIAIELTRDDRPSDYMDHFHLRIKHALIQQLVFARHVFSDKSMYRERRAVIDGTYGSVSDVLEESLAKFDQTTTEDESQQSSLTGVISELTALALLNYPEKPERMAVPSDITSDLNYATDLELFMLPRTRETVRVYHTQVKTSKPRHLNMPFGGILIRAADMSNMTSQNKTTFPTSRAIVRELSGRDTKASAAHLAGAKDHFETKLKTAVTKADRQLDAFERLPTDMKQQMIGTMGRLVSQLLRDYPEHNTLDISIYEPDA